jgi:hypothetical protein
VLSTPENEPNCPANVGFTSVFSGHGLLLIDRVKAMLGVGRGIHFGYSSLKTRTGHALNYGFLVLKTPLHLIL